MKNLTILILGTAFVLTGVTHLKADLPCAGPCPDISAIVEINCPPDKIKKTTWCGNVPHSFWKHGDAEGVKNKSTFSIKDPGTVALTKTNKTMCTYNTSEGGMFYLLNDDPKYTNCSKNPDLACSSLYKTNPDDVVCYPTGGKK